MTARAVHWHEGMFLRPHHLQAGNRHLIQMAERSEKWDCHHNWGIRSIDLDPEALASYRLVIRSLKARMKDGTLVSIPEDGTLPPLDLKEAFSKATLLTVFLAVPLYHAGRRNISEASGDDARFRLDQQELVDENTGDNSQILEVRMLNLKLLTSDQSDQDHAGYEVLPIARITKSERADALPVLDASYIPPILSCDAWKPLQADIVESIFSRVHAKIESHTEQVVSNGVTFDSPGQGDRALLEELRILNLAYGSMLVPTFAAGVHPITMYGELCRLIGALCIVGTERRPPRHDETMETRREKGEEGLPRYDHDDLGRCFWTAKKYIDEYLNRIGLPEYESRAFIGAGLRMQVPLEPKWLEPAYQMFIGVRSELKNEDCVRILTNNSILDMKVGSSDRVEDIFTRGMAGLRFAHSAIPPRALPNRPGLVYFQIDRIMQKEEWDSVRKSLTLAVRLNEHRIAGNIQGQRTLQVKTTGRTVDMDFTLYVTPQGK